LGNVVYGADNETLEGVVMESLAKRNWKLVVLEVNTGGELTRQLSGIGSENFISGKILPAITEGQYLERLVSDELEKHQAQVALALVARPNTGKSEIDIFLRTPEFQKTETRGYGGHPKNVPSWGANSSLELLRSTLA
jgi:hypothetical protein